MYNPGQGIQELCDDPVLGQRSEGMREQIFDPEKEMKLSRQFPRGTPLICPDHKDCPSVDCPHRKIHKEQSWCRYDLTMCMKCRKASKQEETDYTPAHWKQNLKKGMEDDNS